MRASSTVIVWTDCKKATDYSPAGSVAGGPIGEDTVWMGYDYVGGADDPARHKLSAAKQRHAVVMDWWRLVHVYGVDPCVADRAFREIDEYNEAVKELGLDPAQRVLRPTPAMKVFLINGAVHVHPATPERRRTSLAGYSFTINNKLQVPDVKIESPTLRKHFRRFPTTGRRLTRGSAA
jgi:hypothetical protein